jgi:hypothetical protein
VPPEDDVEPLVELLGVVLEEVVLGVLLEELVLLGVLLRVDVSVLLLSVLLEEPLAPSELPLVPPVEPVVDAPLEP